MIFINTVQIWIYKKLIITVLVSYNFNIQALIYSAFKIWALKP